MMFGAAPVPPIPRLRPDAPWPLVARRDHPRDLLTAAGGLAVHHWLQSLQGRDKAR